MRNKKNKTNSAKLRLQRLAEEMNERNKAMNSEKEEKGDNSTQSVDEVEQVEEKAETEEIVEEDTNEATSNEVNSDETNSDEEEIADESDEELEEDSDEAEDEYEDDEDSEDDTEDDDEYEDDEDSEDDEDDEPVKHKKHKKHKGEHHNKKHKKSHFGRNTAIASVAVLALLGAGYCAVGYGYYNNRMMPNTYLNGIDCSNQKEDAIITSLNNQVSAYTLNIKKGGEIIDTITGSDLGVAISNDGKANLQKLFDGQNKLLWAKGYIKGANQITLTDCASADQSKLDAMFSSLKILAVPSTQEFQDAKVAFKEKQFYVQDAINSDKIDENALKQNIMNAAATLATEINIDDGTSYVKNESKADKEKLQAICDKANEKYPTIDLSIKLEGSDINIGYEMVADALTVSDNGDVKINEDSIGKAIIKAENKYSTVGNNIDFKTAHGDTVKVSGGDYGNVMKTDGLMTLMENGILRGEVVNATVPFESNCLNNNPEIGNTYVEVDLTNQYLYMFVNGKKVVETPVVTGLTGERATPQGVYMLKNKMMDVPLVGDNYVTPVKYWMPFNGGIGLHDAVWQSAFGGDRYKYKGSHGCVNLPISKAKEIYDNAVVKMPVICYYHDKLNGFDSVKSPDPVMSKYRALTAKEQSMLSDILSGKKASGAVYDSNAGANAKKYGNANASASTLLEQVENKKITNSSTSATPESTNNEVSDDVASPAGVE